MSRLYRALPLVLLFNSGRVMVLPQGVSKATGLHTALETLRLSPRNTVAIGDRENDHELLRLAEVGVAVSWGSPALRSAADVVLEGWGPPAVAEYVRGLAASGTLPVPRRARRRLLLGYTEDGREFKQPGNLFALVETSTFGTEPKFQAKGAKADLDGDGQVTFPEALPDAQFLLAATTEFVKYAKELDAAAKAWEPKLEDAFTAVVVMTPTMSEYFDAWKNSRFIAGNAADEKGFVATSRLSDISDILGGLVLIYDSIQPSVETVDGQKAQQTERSLRDLHQFAERLYESEQDGKKFTASDADTLGSEAQRRAEAIAGQVSQAAGQLNLQLED